MPMSPRDADGMGQWSCIHYEDREALLTSGAFTNPSRGGHPGRPRAPAPGPDPLVLLHPQRPSRSPPSPPPEAVMKSGLSEERYFAHTFGRHLFDFLWYSCPTRARKRYYIFGFKTYPADGFIRPYRRERGIVPKEHHRASFARPQWTWTIKRLYIN